MIARWAARCARFRSRISRREWVAHLLGMARYESTGTEPGVVLIRIDGLPRAELERVFDEGRMPLLHSLLSREFYRLHTIPGEQPPMPRAAPIGHDGETHSTGSTAGPQFSAAALRWHDVRRRIRPLVLPIVLLLYLPTLLGIGLRILLSLPAAIGGAIQNYWRGANARSEFRLIGERMYFEIILREWKRVGAEIDIARGLPIIYLNFPSSSKHAPRRSPNTAFACLALRDSDRAIGRIWRSAHRSLRREYDVWIYSGHDRGPQPLNPAMFALLPADVPLPAVSGDIPAVEVRRVVARTLEGGPRASSDVQKREQRKTVRVVTYNVHNCLGMDGKLSPRRIARVIAQCDPDVVALQELDVGRQRSGGIDQAGEIARALEMMFHFHPAVELEEERYGDAILSHFPMRLIRAARLPRSDRDQRREPRGAIWVELSVGSSAIQILNTHLGLTRRERIGQVQALVGSEWLRDPRCRAPVILCGDFNAGPSSEEHRMLTRRLRGPHQAGGRPSPQPTFFSPWPIFRIDHIFTSDDVELVRAEVVRTTLARKASDHLPLVVEVRLRSSSRSPRLPAAGHIE